MRCSGRTFRSRILPAVCGSYATSETVGRYHTAPPQSGSYIVLATSLRDCLRQTARIYIGRELYAVHTDAADKARGNSSGVPLHYLDCANSAHIYARTKVRVEEPWKVIFINVRVFFPFRLYNLSETTVMECIYILQFRECVLIIKSWYIDLRKNITV